MFRFWQSLAYGASATLGTTFTKSTYKLKPTAGTDRHLFYLEREDHVWIAENTIRFLLNRFCVSKFARLVDQAQALMQN